MYPNQLLTSNDELKRRLNNALHACGASQAGDVEIEAAGGIVVLRGRLPAAADKRQFLECCRHVPGVLRLIDQVQCDAATSAEIVAN